MGTRFRKSIKLGSGVKLNVGKTGLSLSAGTKGARVTMNSKGRVTGTVGVPGTGVSYTSTLGSGAKSKRNKSQRYDYNDYAFNEYNYNSAINYETKKKTFTIRFLGIDNTLFYADENSIELIYNYGKSNQITKKWETSEIERAEIQENFLMFGSENACLGYLRFNIKTHIKQAERFVDIIENGFEKPVLITQEVLKKETMPIYINNLNSDFINDVLREYIKNIDEVEKQIILEVQLQKDAVGVNILFENNIIGKIYPRNTERLDLIRHSFLFFENYNFTKEYYIKNHVFDLLKERELNLGLINFVITNTDETAEREKEISDFLEKEKIKQSKKQNRVPYPIPQIEKKKINYTKFILPAFIILVLIGMFSGNRFITPSEKITLDEFNKIQTGMTYDEVVKIIGSQGELLSQADMELKGLEELGIKSGDLKTEMYMWYGADNISNANVMFQGGKVISKAQLGLK
jgi:hypothetical protein cdifA_02588|nr:MAG TPA: Protein of unknown function (DUF4236) [Caudoviricetes sp.]